MPLRLIVGLPRGDSSDISNTYYYGPPHEDGSGEHSASPIHLHIVVPHRSLSILLSTAVTSIVYLTITLSISHLTAPATMNESCLLKLDRQRTGTDVYLEGCTSRKATQEMFCYRGGLIMPGLIL